LCIADDTYFVGHYCRTRAGLSAKRGFLLSLSYVVGMATTYALAGMAVGYFGASANLSAWMQSPVVLSFLPLFLCC
jgi:thiol:disulfide interchange protein DsbD